MKKIFSITLTAALAFSMMSNTNTVSAVEGDTPVPLGSEDTNATVKFTDGGISLGNFTSSFDINDNTVIDDDSMISTSKDGLEITVNDFRGNGAGWGLTAKRTVFNEAGEETLDGAVLVLTGVNVDEGSDVPLDVLSEITIGTTPSSVMNATGSENFSEAQGRGTSKLISGAKLTVPNAMASVGNHSSTITWTLANAEQ